MEHEITDPEMPEAPEPRTLTLAEIMAAATDNMRPESIYIPGWGGWITVRPLRMSETERIARIATNPTTGVVDDAKLKVLLVLEAVIEPKLGFAEAQKLMLDSKAGDIKWLWAEVNRISGMGAEAVGAAMRSFRRQPAAGGAVPSGEDARQDG